MGKTYLKYLCNMDMLTKNVTMFQAIRSETAARLGIKNIPPDDVRITMEILSDAIIEPLIASAPGTTVIITSFYRSPVLNKAVKGAVNSQHELGEAVDLVFANGNNSLIFDYISRYLAFDQLIWEFGTKTNPQWVHVSYSVFGNRNQVLESYKDKNNKTHYKPFKR